MPTKLYRTKVVVLIILSLVQWRGPSNSHFSCPRDKSSCVRRVVQKKFMPVLARYRASLPLTCPFSPERDIYGLQEGQKIEEGPAHWRCGLCGKAFYSEAYLDKHFDLRHATVLNTKYDAVCLARYCDIMRCEVLLAKQSLPSSVYDAAAESSQAVAQVQMNSAIKSTLKKLGWTEGCKDTELLQLRTKCQVIIRDCISGLLLNLSLKDFQEIEEDLNKAVCSYLTCEKYWDNPLTEGRSFPFVFVTVLLVILIGGMCLCYYIVWIVFDSSEYYAKEEFGDAAVHNHVYGEHLVCVQYNHKCDLRRRMVDR